MTRKKRKRGEPRPERGQHPLCGWCGKPIAYGAESDNFYEAGDEWIAKGVPHMGPVHKSHVPEEDHPLYEQMPHIVLTGLPSELEELW
jgi:hypothetical protein